jgi:hypothetical protein
MHDYDNNSMLDGLEILQAISHVLPMTELGDGEEVPSTIDLTSSPPSPPRNSQPDDHPTNRKLTKQEAIQQRQEDFDYYVGK